MSAVSANVIDVHTNGSDNTTAKSPSQDGNSTALYKLIGAVIIMAVVATIGILPFAGATGAAVNASVATISSNLDDITENKSLPEATVITDRYDKPLAWIYDQRRFAVATDQISSEMKKSIVAIEDRRFYEHGGVDFRSTMRALVANLSEGGVAEGASTLNQQYVKNYLYLIKAKSDEDRAAATEHSAARKLREMKLASDMNEKFSKDEILTRYLNLVSYGRGSFGIESAARTFFGHSAKTLNAAESALLAGIVQSTNALDPWNNPEGALKRRNQVLQARVSNGSLTQAEADEAAAQPLGILKTPGGEANGCIGAGNAGFFCDYALQWLESKGFDHDKIAQGGYRIKTTLDPVAQENATNAARQYVNEQEPGVAETLNFISPRKTGHEVVAMASSRKYGLDTDAHETVLPLPHSLQGHGAGSIFKIFVAAGAIEKGMGLNTRLNVPSRVEVEGLGDGGAEGCPPGKYCVENAGPYKPSMSLQEALATSPNTPFISMLQDVGLERTVDIAVKLGLRSYAREGTSGDKSIAQRVKDEQSGSFVLGPTPVDPLELTNVAATLADHGRWCEPTPVLSIQDANGEDVELPPSECEQAINPQVADTLAHGMGSDVSSGTAAASASAAGWNGPISAKTGTTETSFSASFMGFTQNLAGTSYIFNDSGTSSNLCTGPVRQCGNGNLYGGNEPALSFFTAAGPLADRYGGQELPSVSEEQRRGSGELADGGATRAQEKEESDDDDREGSGRGAGQGTDDMRETARRLGNDINNITGLDLDVDAFVDGFLR